MGIDNTESPIAVERLLHFVRTSGVWLDWFFDEYLLLANVISAALLLGAGDLSVQTIEQLMMDGNRREGQRRAYDMVRNRRTMIVGLVLGLFDHFWYESLDHYLRGNSLNVVLKKVLLDQIVAGPFFCSSFIIGMCLLEGLSGARVYQEWREKFPSIYKADWMFWPAAQVVNFYLLAPKYRVVYVNAVTFFWNSFLSYKKHNDGRGNAPENCILGFRSEVKNSAIFSSSKKLKWPTPPVALSLPQVTYKNRSPIKEKKSTKAPVAVAVKRSTTKTPKRTSPNTVNKRKLPGKKKTAGGVAKKRQVVEMDESSCSNADLRRNSVLQGELLDIARQVKFLADVTIGSREFMEQALQETREEVNKLSLTLSEVMSVLRESKLGLVNVAKQIISVVQAEGKSGSEALSRSVDDVLTKLETKLLGLHMPGERAAGEQADRAQDASKQFTLL
ncbi:hypothetical protein Btru_014384 [Bulinus truncatus]|nr:hypothetical protein Btru_014384 [Bulinus truncatus]